MPSKPETPSILELWKIGIETQKHFAELSLKMRQLGLTLAGATLALAIVLYRSDGTFSLAIPFTNWLAPVSAILAFAASAILYGAKILDADMYHQMLRGAVKFNEILESERGQELGIRVGLTETISAYSRSKTSPTLQNKREDGKIWALGKSSLAGNKITLFYRISIFSLIGSGIVLIIIENSAKTAG